MRFGWFTAVLSGLFLACSARGCRDSERTATAAPSRSTVAAVTVSVNSGASAAPRPRSLKAAMQELTWTFSDSALGRIDVVVVLPDRRPEQRFPLLVALHGRGEAMKGSQRGARGWVDDYALMRAMRRLSEPPLTAADFEGFVQSDRLALLNRSLRAEPYRGLVVLCPYTPDVLTGDRPFERILPYAKFLVQQLLPRAYRELPVEARSAATGIDGISLGGRVAVLSGLDEPQAFGIVGGMQAAFDSEDAPKLAAMAVAARHARPSLVIKLLTSEGDYFLNANRALSRALSQEGVPHRFFLVPGPHDYPFNRGPGALEMLLFHDRTLRGEPAP